MKLTQYAPNLKVCIINCRSELSGQIGAVTGTTISPTPVKQDNDKYYAQVKLSDRLGGALRDRRRWVLIGRLRRIDCSN